MTFIWVPAVLAGALTATLAAGERARQTSLTLLVLLLPLAAFGVV